MRRTMVLSLIVAATLVSCGPKWIQVDVSAEVRFDNRTTLDVGMSVLDVTTLAEAETMSGVSTATIQLSTFEDAAIHYWFYTQVGVGTPEFEPTLIRSVQLRSNYLNTIVFYKDVVTEEYMIDVIYEEL